jgi:CBS domain-containing protein/anti-sigma regulatory factor (Ser/Thr protein kinase)
MIASNRESRFTKIQELVYELKVDQVMSRDLITVGADTLMSELRAILRDNRISGTPVVEGRRMLGLVSVEDFINWLIRGGRDCPVGQIMSREIRTVFADEPLVHAVSKLERFGYGRLPVLDRETGTLEGLITKGDIIEGLLHELQIDYHDEEIHRYRASHFFEDMIADRVTIRFHYHIRGKRIEQGGEVASDLKRSLKRLGIHPADVRRAAIATYEAEMNVIIYAEEGRVDVSVEPAMIVIEVKDRGQGIADVDRALEPGYSTAPDWVRELGFGAGMGLPNIRNCARDLEIASTVGQGTTLKIRIPLGVEEKRCA